MYKIKKALKNRSIVTQRKRKIRRRVQRIENIKEKEKFAEEEQII